MDWTHQDLGGRKYVSSSRISTPAPQYISPSRAKKMMTDPDYHLPGLTHRASVESLSSISSSYGSIHALHSPHPPVDDFKDPNFFFPRTQSPSLLVGTPSLVDSATETTARKASSARRLEGARASMPQNSNMPPLPGSVPIPITYTPTTHRISKAKKGKKVHVCEFGCGKVFTRAEHRKRHEANHRDKPLFTCSVVNCGKPFQRRDLLERHMEKQHGVQAQPEGLRQRASSIASSTAGLSTSSMATSMGNHLQHSPSPSLSSTSQPGTPSFSTTQLYNQRVRYGGSSSYEAQGMAPPHFTPTMTPNFVYSGTTSAEVSPMMQTAMFYPPVANNFDGMHTQNTQQYAYYQRPTTMYASEAHRVPVSAPMGYGPPAYGAYGQSGAGLGIGFEDQLAAPAPVGRSVLVDRGFSNVLMVKADQTATAPANVDPGGRSDVRFNAAHDAAIVAAEDMISIDEEVLSHYEKCYWRHIDPTLAVVHGASYAAPPAPDILRDAMCALGAQMSPQALAKRHSRMLATRARRQVQSLDPTSFATILPLAALQGIFLLEYLDLYRSTRPGVHGSSHFASLFHELQRTYSNTIAGANSVVNHDHHTWVGVESRHRLLAACFVLDTHRRLLFDQPALATYPAGIEPPIPRPCSAALWLADTSDEWYSRVQTVRGDGTYAPRRHQQAHQHSAVNIHGNLVQNLTPASTSCTVAPTGPTPFDNAVEHALSLHTHETISPSTHADPVASTLQLATLTPVRHLVTTASCSWLFAEKVSASRWNSSRTALRAWLAGSPDDAAVAAWLAGKLLRGHFFPLSAAGDSLTPTTARSDPGPQPAGSQHLGTPGHQRFGLEADWCLYLCTLVLWAYTYPISGGSTPGLPTQAATALGYRGAATPPPLTGSYTAPRRADTHPPPYARLPSAHTYASPAAMHQPSLPATGMHAPPPPFPASGVQRPQRHRRGTASISPIGIPRSLRSARSARSGSRRGSSLSPASPGGAASPKPHPHPPSPLRTFLDRVCTTTPAEVAVLRGTGGVRPVLDAVKAWLEGRRTDGGRSATGSAAGDRVASLPGVVEEKGALVGESVGVLARLSAGSGIWF